MLLIRYGLLCSCWTCCIVLLLSILCYWLCCIMIRGKCIVCATVLIEMNVWSMMRKSRTESVLCMVCNSCVRMSLWSVSVTCKSFDKHVISLFMLMVLNACWMRVSSMLVVLLLLGDSLGVSYLPILLYWLLPTTRFCKWWFILWGRWCRWGGSRGMIITSVRNLFSYASVEIG